MEFIESLLSEQAGVISRRQALAAGLADHDVKRMLRRRDLAPIRPGVYVSHTGSPSWLEQAWSALLAVSGREVPHDVALAHWSAIRIEEGPGRRGAQELPIRVAIAHDRRVRAPSGVIVQRMRSFDERVHPSRWPQRLRYEEAVLDVALDLPPLDGLGVLSRAVGSRRSTAGRLLKTAQRRQRVRGRTWIEEVLSDVEAGTHSVLERGFLTEVLRPHGLPRPSQQQREETALGVVYRDAALGEVLVELDGRMDHADFEGRNADLDRDLQAFARGRRTVRLGWAQVFGRPCVTAEALGRALSRTALPCGQTCCCRAVG